MQCGVSHFQDPVPIRSKSHRPNQLIFRLRFQHYFLQLAIAQSIGSYVFEVSIEQCEYITARIIDGLNSI